MALCVMVINLRGLAQGKLKIPDGSNDGQLSAQVSQHSPFTMIEYSRVTSNTFRSRVSLDPCCIVFDLMLMLN